MSKTQLQNELSTQNLESHFTIDYKLYDWFLSFGYS
jgi:hypothetical protein